MGSRPGANRRHKFNFPVSPKESFLFGEVDPNAKGTRPVVRSNSHETSHDLDVVVFRRQPESVGFVSLTQFPRVRARAEQDIYKLMISERRREHESSKSSLTRKIVAKTLVSKPLLKCHWHGDREFGVRIHSFVEHFAKRVCVV